MNHTAAAASQRAVKRFALIAAAVLASLASLAAVTSTASATIYPGLQGCINVSTLKTAPPPVNWTDGRSSPKEQEAYIVWATTNGLLPTGYWNGTVNWGATYSAYNSSTGNLAKVPLSEDCASTYAFRRPSDGILFKTSIRTRLHVYSSAGDVDYGSTRYRRVCAYPANNPVDGNGIPTGSNCLLLTNYNVG